MFIKTDSEMNVISLISVGSKPSENGYEINKEDIPDDILSDIFNYKYINGEFIKKENVDDNKLIELKSAKIKSMSEKCEEIITNGININEAHYSLHYSDQIELLKLGLEIEMGLPVEYHEDGCECRLFSYEEMGNLINLSTRWIKYHRKYYNSLRDEIRNMNTIEEVLSVKYGMRLNDSHQLPLDELISGCNFIIETIEDDNDYNMILNPVNISNMNFDYVPLEPPSEYIDISSLDESDEYTNDEETYDEEVISEDTIIETVTSEEGDVIIDDTQ